MIASLPRPVLMGLIGVVVVGGLFVMTRGGSEDQSGAPSPAPATQTTQPAPTVTPSTSSTNAPSNAARPTEPRPTRPQDGSAKRTLPAPVRRALDAHKVVVLLFWNPRGTDDRSVKGAVDALPESKRVAVFTDSTKNVSRYTKITSSADVNQTPALVVVDRQRDARVATGYLDSTTVEQYVVDALHAPPK